MLLPVTVYALCAFDVGFEQHLNQCAFIVYHITVPDSFQIYERKTSPYVAT